ncbi:ras-related protein Rab-17-like [Nematolebias whitei]|uniref:ras-related protein Rab-17-like n=1 Tax=Nematolebias whitei TaxID=451745 RepID=UPI0018985EF1|nr:ras-related protein Rab-17-like [Nematolebias whitei]
MAETTGGARLGPVRTLRVKMVLLGSSGVGKSSLALRFSRDQFRNTSPTVGCAYLTRVLHLGDVTFRLEIWDTAGQEKYHSVTPLYYRAAHAALVVYDICKRETFLRARLWIRELQKHYVPGSTVLWLVGNKADLDQDRQVSAQEGQNVAEEDGLSFTETSALSGDQINQLLLDVVHRVHECVGGQQEVLSLWQEVPLVDPKHGSSFNRFSSCCRAGP